jgi:hypothetical protein
MPKDKCVKLTDAEIRHILNLLYSNSEDGEYYGSVEEYWKRSARIASKLEEELVNEQ